MAELHLRRLRAELCELLSGAAPTGICIEDSSNLQCWTVSLVGASGTLYDGEEYVLRFRFSNDYPMEAPEMRPPDNDQINIFPLMRASSILCETFKRAQRGLYAGEHIRFGNQVSEMGNKTRRTWKPNVQRVRLWSETLQDKLKVRLTMTALELIDKAGGLDAYILGQRIPESKFAATVKTRILMKKWEVERGMRVQSTNSAKSTETLPQQSQAIEPTKLETESLQQFQTQGSADLKTEPLQKSTKLGIFNPA